MTKQAENRKVTYNLVPAGQSVSRYQSNPSAVVSGIDTAWMATSAKAYCLRLTNDPYSKKTAFSQPRQARAEMPW